MQNSRNPTIRKFDKDCCSWGAPTIIPSQDYVGGPVPLLRNPAAKFFRRLAILNVTFTVLACIAAGGQYGLNLTAYNKTKSKLKNQLGAAYEAEGITKTDLELGNEVDKFVVQSCSEILPI